MADPAVRHCAPPEAVYFDGAVSKPISLTLFLEVRETEFFGRAN